MTNAEQAAGGIRQVMARPLHERLGPMGRQLTQLVLLTGCALLSYLLISHFVLQSVRVVGSSMVPTLQDSERYLLNRWIYHVRQPEHSEIVVIRDPADGGFSVKRIIAVEGDTITLRNKMVYLNGKLLAEPYLAPGTPTFSGFRNPEYTVRVERNQFFVLGDNRRNSVDSRSYGLVPRDNVLGKLIQ